MSPDQVLRSAIEAGRLPGAVWRVEDLDGGFASGAVGLRSRVPEMEATTLDTVYDLASLTKPLATALIAVLLEEEGTLDLDAPLSSWLDELELSPAGSPTLAELGGHRAGLPAWWPLYLEGSSVAVWIERIVSRPPVSGVLYSDLGYFLLGWALERATGERLDVLFAHFVAGPLGLARTGFGPAPSHLVAPTEEGNRFERDRVASDWPELASKPYPWRELMIRGEVHDGNTYAMGGVSGAAGLFGTAEEVARIAMAILQPGRLALTARSRARLLDPGDGGRTFGFVAAEASGAARGVLPPHAPGHTGFTGTSVWLDPGAGRVHVLLANRVHPRVSPQDFQDVRAEFHRRARGVQTAPA